MYYTILYALMACSIYFAKAVLVDYKKVPVPQGFVYLEVGYLIIFVVYITLGHFLWSKRALGKLKKRKSNVLRDVPAAMDNISFMVIGIILLCVVDDWINGIRVTREEFIEYAPAVVLILLPVYVYKGVVYGNRKTRIRQLVDDVNDKLQSYNNVVIFESECYKKLINRGLGVFQCNSHRMAKHFSKNKFYHSIYVIDDYIFIPDVIEGVVINKENTIHRIEEESLLNTNRSIQTALTDFIRENSGSSIIKSELEKNFLPILDGVIADTGKYSVCKMAQDICNSLQKPVEYFYDLMKLAEYMTHYQSLADYEEVNKGYFNTPKEMSFGAFADSIIESDKSELYKNPDFEKSYKCINNLVIGKYGSLPSRNLAHMTRMLMVQVRNRFIGHGVMTYSVQEDIVIALAKLLCPLLEDFLYYSNSLSTEYIGNLKKREGDFLLLCVYDNKCGLYLNYNTGETKEVGGNYYMNLETE